MEIVQTELDGGVLCVALEGALDIAGAADVDMPLSIVSGSRDKVIVDMSGVTFLASIGIRTLVKAARAIKNRGGALVLAGPDDAARKVLSSTGVDAIVPIADDEADALARLNG
ncbi:MAG: STAS domain-containing protein [Pseudomonadota bacterium]